MIPNKTNSNKNNENQIWKVKKSYGVKLKKIFVIW